ncbi:hypothetical protein LUW75_03850 [Streptomyces sp. MRC013]|uniref:hypothetical protein n=1 Tax=Streptomyces sp. MRC013 TaxID=2898276 RepID=UPI002026DD62|nr:hypothetical protein [Streptomyces sp. MRC013]URM89285.1 hypothetical protein LUW75_03850 [Streptomyces sp. MRC013]
MTEQAAVPPRDGLAPFCVLLGPDHAGKSSVMTRLRGLAPAWRLISDDDGFLAPEHTLLRRLRRDVVTDVARHESAWSPQFLTAMLHTAIVHLHDRLARDASGAPAVVDSYYYKYLAKCLLSGAPEEPLPTWWRALPRPRRVIYLDVSPEAAWERARRGAALNPLEYYGEHPTWEGFKRYQTDLAKVMADEIQDLPVTVIEAENCLTRVVGEIREVLEHELG